MLICYFFVIKTLDKTLDKTLLIHYKSSCSYQSLVVAHGLRYLNYFKLSMKINLTQMRKLLSDVFENFLSTTQIQIAWNSGWSQNCLASLQQLLSSYKQ